jgi:hypothetical protein
MPNHRSHHFRKRVGRAALGRLAELREWRLKPRGRRGKHLVAQTERGGRNANAWAVDGGNQRLGKIDKGGDKCGHALGRLFCHLLGRQARGRSGGEIGQIVARRVVCAASSQHAHADAVVRAGPLEGLDHFVIHVRVEGIEALRAIQKDGGESLVLRDGDGGECGRHA